MLHIQRRDNGSVNTGCYYVEGEKLIKKWKLDESWTCALTEQHDVHEQQSRQTFARGEMVQNILSREMSNSMVTLMWCITQ